MKKIIIITISVLALATGSIFSYNYYSNYRKVSELREQELIARANAWLKLKEYIKKATVGYKGEVAIVIEDLDMNWRIESNKDMLIPSASLVKIPVMMSYFSAVEDGKLKFSDSIELRRSDMVEGSAYLSTICPGSECKIEDLINPMITRSDNTAANMLINRLGLDELNRYFAKFGLKHTNLSRKMMDFKSRKEGVENYTTVGDMAYLLEQLYRGKFINKDISKRCLELLSQQKINDRIPKKLPSDIVVAHKTGLERGVCHDVGIVYTAKGDYMICILTKHEYTTARTTKQLISRLSLLTYNYYNSF